MNEINNFHNLLAPRAAAAHWQYEVRLVNDYYGSLLGTLYTLAQTVLAGVTSAWGESKSKRFQETESVSPQHFAPIFFFKGTPILQRLGHFLMKKSVFFSTKKKPVLFNHGWLVPFFFFWGKLAWSYGAFTGCWLVSSWIVPWPQWWSWWIWRECGGMMEIQARLEHGNLRKHKKWGDPNRIVDITQATAVHRVGSWVLSRASYENRWFAVVFSLQVHPAGRFKRHHRWVGKRGRCPEMSHFVSQSMACGRRFRGQCFPFSWQATDGYHPEGLM